MPEITYLIVRAKSAHAAKQSAPVQRWLDEGWEIVAIHRTLPFEKAFLNIEPEGGNKKEFVITMRKSRSADLMVI